MHSNPSPTPHNHPTPHHLLTTTQPPTLSLQSPNPRSLNSPNHTPNPSTPHPNSNTTTPHPNPHILNSERIQPTTPYSLPPNSQPLPPPHHTPIPTPSFRTLQPPPPAHQIPTPTPSLPHPTPSHTTQRRCTGSLVLLSLLRMKSANCMGKDYSWTHGSTQFHGQGLLMNTRGHPNSWAGTTHEHILLSALLLSENQLILCLLCLLYVIPDLYLY